MGPWPARGAACWAEHQATDQESACHRTIFVVLLTVRVALDTAAHVLRPPFASSRSSVQCTVGHSSFRLFSYSVRSTRPLQLKRIETLVVTFLEVTYMWSVSPSCFPLWRHWEETGEWR